MFDKLGAEVILRCDVFDKHDEEIRLRQHIVELDDGTKVHIIRDEITKSNTKIPIPEAKIYAKQTRRTTDRLFKRKKTRVEPESQTWVEVSIAQAGLIMVEKLSRVYDRHSCKAATGDYLPTP